METVENKLNFIRVGFVPLLTNLVGNEVGKWGKMNAQQMVQHLSEIFKFSSQKTKFPLVTPAEQLPAYKAFLLSDKEFRENTRAPESIVPEKPMPLRNNSFEDATNELQHEITAFTRFFENNPEVKTGHPVFGDLVFDEWVLFHHKHVTHHLKQFGLL